MKRRTQLTIFPILILILASSCKKNDSEEILSKETSPANASNGKTTAVFNPNVTYGIMTDQEGNIYKTVTIGTQTWMAENLRTTKYNDDTDIPNVIDKNKWEALTTGAYCTYNNTTNIDTIATYGRLYNWYAVNTKKLAPKGWHVPSNAEWSILIEYLGGKAVAGGKLKETGTTHWAIPNTGATNETGFTALPGSYRYNGGFSDFGNFGDWWSTTESNTATVQGRFMKYNETYVVQEDYNKLSGLSVRCVKD